MRPASVSLAAGVTGPSAWLPIDPYTDADLNGLFVKFVSTGSAAVEITPDDVFNPAVTPIAFALPTPFAPAAANAYGQLPLAAKAVRLNATANVGGVTLTVVVSGTQ